jgi:D-alanyl-D-alanine carboxypeptidase
MKQLAAIQKTFVKSGAPGSILLVEAPGVKYSRATGYADVDKDRKLTPRTLFRIASVSKSFFGAMASILHVRGKINLDAPLSETYPEAAARFAPKKDPETGEVWDPGAITMRMLLNHSAGVADPLNDNMEECAGFKQALLKHVSENTGPTDKEALDAIFSEGLLYKPGAKLRYSNGGYMLSAYLVELKMGAHYSRVLRDEVLSPLRLRNTYNGVWEKYDLDNLAHGYNSWLIPGYEDYGVIDQGNGYANGGLVSTAEDVSKFFRAVFKDPAFPPGIDKAGFLSQFVPGPASPEAGGIKMGTGIVQDQQGCYLHSGHFAGYLSQAMYCPRQDLFIFVGLTSDSPALSQAKDRSIDQIRKLWIP